MVSSADVRIPSPSWFERALAKALSDDLPIPLREILNSETSPSEWLPFLAAHDSVDLWFQDWSDERKRLMISMAPILARLKGTPAATQPFLNFVDGLLIDKISYPKKFVIGRSVIGRDPIGHPPFVARHLVKVETLRPPRAHVIGRSPIGRNPIKTPTREPFRRARLALAVSKGASTEYRVDFQHKRIITIADAVPIDGTYALGQHINRVKL